jgi:hypothetical protein
MVLRLPCVASPPFSAKPFSPPLTMAVTNSEMRGVLLSFSRVLPAKSPFSMSAMSHGPAP